jgi:hypothetical protein
VTAEGPRRERPATDPARDRSAGGAPTDAAAGRPPDPDDPAGSGRADVGLLGDDLLVRSARRFGEPDLRGVPRQAGMPWLWFSVVGGLAAHAVHLGGIYWPLERCTGADRIVASVATVVAVAIAAAATIAGARALAALPAPERRRSPPGREPVPAERPREGAFRRLLGWLLGRSSHDRDRIADGWDPVPDAALRRWLAVTGTFMSGLALTILLLVAVAVVVVPPCF